MAVDRCVVCSGEGKTYEDCNGWPKCCSYQCDYCKGKGYMKETLEEVLEALYVSEINAQIQWCWDGGFDVAMGNTSVSGYGFAQNAAAEANFKTVAEVTEWLSETAKKLYPKSLFAIEREPATT